MAKTGGIVCDNVVGTSVVKNCAAIVGLGVVLTHSPLYAMRRECCPDWRKRQLALSNQHMFSWVCPEVSQTGSVNLGQSASQEPGLHSLFEAIFNTKLSVFLITQNA
jgi:hypothetical protein